MDDKEYMNREAAQKPVLTQSQWEKAEVTGELKWKEKK